MSEDYGGYVSNDDLGEWEHKDLRREVRTLRAQLAAVERERDEARRRECRSEEVLPAITPNTSAVCGSGRYYAELFGEHQPSYHDLSHLYAAAEQRVAALTKALTEVRAGLARRLAPGWNDPSIEIIDAVLRATPGGAEG